MYATLEAKEIRPKARYSLPDRQKLYANGSHCDRRFLYAVGPIRAVHELTVFDRKGNSLPKKDLEMKVSQLIQLLSSYPTDTEVLVEGYENGYDPLHSVYMQTLAKVLNAADYDGLFDAPENLVLDVTGETLTGIQRMARRENGEHHSYLVITGLRGHRR